MSTTPRFLEGCRKMSFNEVLVEIKEITNGEQEDCIAEFNENTKIGKHESPREFVERLEHIVESLDGHHSIHKTASEVIDLILMAAKDTKILVDTVKHIRRERKRETPTDLELVKFCYDKILNQIREIEKGKRKGEVAAAVRVCQVKTRKTGWKSKC